MDNNLITNGDFETGNFTNWTGTTWHTYISNTDCHRGIYSYNIRFNDQYNTFKSWHEYKTNTFTILENDIYNVSFWYKVFNVSHSIGSSISMYIQVDSNTILTTTTITNGWVHFETTIPMDSGTHTFSIHVTSYSGSIAGLNLISYVDDIIVFQYIEPSSITSLYDVQLRRIITDNITPLNYPVTVTIMGKTAWIRIDWSDDYSETVITGF